VQKVRIPLDIQQNEVTPISAWHIAPYSTKKNTVNWSAKT